MSGCFLGSAASIGVADLACVCVHACVSRCVYVCVCGYIIMCVSLVCFLQIEDAAEKFKYQVKIINSKAKKESIVIDWHGIKEKY